MPIDYAYANMNGHPENPELLAGSNVVAFDVEASGTNIGTGVPYGFSLSCDPRSAYYADVGCDYLRIMLSNPSKLKIAHNASYDRSMMKKVGVTIDNLCDTMIAAHLLEEPRLSLKALALKWLNLDVVSYSELTNSLSTMTIDELLHYSGPHSIAALMLWEKFQEQMRKLKLLDVFWNIEMPFVPVISDMELNGVAVSEEVLTSLGEELDSKITSIVSSLDYWSGCPGMNHNSPDQLSNLLYNKLKLPPGRTTNTGYRPSVDAEYVKTLSNHHPYIKPYLFYKELQTLKSSYVNSLIKQLVNGRVYGSFNQAGTRTGRLSSSNPNLQKIPVRTPTGRKIRAAFVAPPGHTLVRVDYNQLELRMMAHYSQDKAMVDAFSANHDIHAETAIRVFDSAERRSEGKTLNFQIVYGGGGMTRRGMFFAAYPTVEKWTKATISRAREAGYVRTYGGRIRVIPELESNLPKIREHGGREAISTIIQGSSAEVVKIGMVNAWKALKSYGSKMVLQVHDEVVCEVPDSTVEDVVRILGNVMPYYELSVPLTVEVEVGKSWDSMSKVNNRR